MKVEKLNVNKLKIILTNDDLFENGLTVEDIKENCIKVHVIIQRVVEQACEKMGFQMIGAIEIEIYSIQAQGIIMIITRGEDSYCFEEDDLVDLQVILEEKKHLIYTFENFEHIIQLCKVLKKYGVKCNSAIYFYNGFYYLLLEQVCLSQYETVTSLLAEYGEYSILSGQLLMEYGKEIFENQAIQWITYYFEN